MDNVKMEMFCLFLLFMVSLFCDAYAAEAKQGMSISAKKFEVQKHLNRLNKPAVKSIKVKSSVPFSFWLHFFVYFSVLMVSFGENNRAQMVISSIVLTYLINQLLIILYSRIIPYR